MSPNKLFLPLAKWNVSQANLKHFLRLFFTVGPFLLLNSLQDFIFRSNFLEAKLLWSVRWGSFFGQEFLTILPILIYFLTLVVSLFAAWKVESRIFRFILIFLLFQLMSFSNSFGSIRNSEIGWICCGFFLCFCKFEQGEFWDKMNRSLVHGAISMFLLFYFISGLDKLKLIFIGAIQGDSVYSLMSEFIPNALTYAKMQEGYQSIIPNFFFQPSAINAVICLFCLLFEVGAIVAMFFPGLIPFWGFLVIVFHLVNRFLVNAGFSLSILLAICLLLFHPLRKAED